MGPMVHQVVSRVSSNPPAFVCQQVQRRTNHVQRKSNQITLAGHVVLSRLNQPAQTHTGESVDCYSLLATKIGRFPEPLQKSVGLP
ncbi:hypothetical protein Pan181_20280 [Aeoliella mucimassa]|uniref:Uncharacterized protein n=1 Tax=Aeoliella mucimassa TaxID=2527972 RepID=A0A518AM86_9BACT|nr:hypothetical protein Pan181_20280 [Aeoliella mucimassa]